MIHIKPPTQLPEIFRKTLFLAGSIEMGVAAFWQERVTNMLIHDEITILNPRRDNWDPSWVQDIEHVEFRKQVEWEMRGLERTTQIIMFFDPGTKSPITLLELGLCARDASRLVVCCPRGYWRKGNVDIVCKRYGVMTCETLFDAVVEIKKRMHLTTPIIP